MISETLPKVAIDKASQGKRAYNSDRSADKHRHNVLPPLAKNPHVSHSLHGKPESMNTDNLRGRSKRASESFNQSLQLDEDQNNALFPVKVNRPKEDKAVETRSRNSAIYVGQSPNTNSPRSKQSEGSLDFNKIIDEPAVRNQFTQEKGSYDEVVHGTAQRSKVSSYRSKSEHTEHVTIPAGHQLNLLDDQRKTLPRDPNDTFKLTLNEKFRTGLRDYQQYLSYCNPIELERLVRISDMKRKLKQKRRDLDNSTQMFGDLAVNDFSVNPMDYYAGYHTRKSRKPTPFKLRDISYTRDYSRDENLADASFVLNKSKISPIKDFSWKRTPKASQAELELEGNSFIYDPLASEKGFANRFKVVEPIKGVAKHMAYLTDLREKNRAKLEAQKRNLHKSPVDLKAAKARREKNKTPVPDRDENTKMLIELMKNEFEIQNEKIEALTQRLIEEFEIQ